MIHNLVGGGGSLGNPIAVIRATFPEGSNCICSDGVKTLTAKGTSLCLFPIPYKASWTVTASTPDGTESASETVEINAEGQIHSVDLAYHDYVIHNGVLKSGYRINTSTATYEVVDGALVFKSTVASSGNGSITIDANGTAIDLSKRSTLNFDVAATSPRSGTLDYVRLGVSTATSVTKNLGVNSPITRQTIPISVSNVSSGSISLFISDNPATVELKIYNAWFD